MQYFLYLRFGLRVDDDDNKKVSGVIGFRGSLSQGNLTFLEQPQDSYYKKVQETGEVK